jgi:hypothetical protein
MMSIPAVLLSMLGIIPQSQGKFHSNSSLLEARHSLLETGNLNAILGED